MFKKQFRLLVISILFLLLIKCSSKPIEKNKIKIDNNVIIDKLEENNWFKRLLINVLGYGFVLIPIALIVLLVKNDLCLKTGIYLLFTLLFLQNIYFN
jgi:hypothetical protein